VSYLISKNQNVIHPKTVDIGPNTKCNHHSLIYFGDETCGRTDGRTDGWTSFLIMP